MVSANLLHVTFISRPSTVNFASLVTFKQTIADVGLTKYVKSSS